jgi:hypothetical protein
VMNQGLNVDASVGLFFKDWQSIAEGKTVSSPFIQLYSPYLARVQRGRWQRDASLKEGVKTHKYGNACVRTLT